jgi:uncharacterized membrane protein YoaK (UPF0700 family)
MTPTMSAGPEPQVQSDDRPGLAEVLKLAFLDERHGPLPALLIALTVVAGLLDATTILRLGHVFVATMTGNLVFLGLAAAGAKGFTVATAGLSVVGFILGVLIGGRTLQTYGAHRGLALSNVLRVKLCLAGSVGVLSVITGPHFSNVVVDVMVVLLSASMGAQLATIRYLKVPDLMTVVMTLTITGVIVERQRGWHDYVMVRRALGLLAFAIGALTGGLLVLNVGVSVALLFGVAIMAGTAIGAYRASRSSASWSAPV